jgi:hypothetical protein
VTIDELIEKLEEAKESLSGEAEVMLGHQPSYPMRYSIAGVALLGNNPVCPDCEERYLSVIQDSGNGVESPRVWQCPGKTCGATLEDDDLVVPKEDREVCWIVEGGQPYDRPYAPRALWEEEAMI